MKEKAKETMKDLIAKSKDFKRPKKSSSTQTAVHKDGFWDMINGWMLPVSLTAEARADSLTVVRPVRVFLDTYQRR